MDLHIQHFGHEHVLRLENLNPDGGRREYCNFCCRTIRGEAYGCYLIGCKFYIDKQCAELPREVVHPFHPQHPLIINGPAGYMKSFPCNACGDCKCSFAYSCSECEYYLGVNCASLMPVDDLENLGTIADSYIICQNTKNCELKCSGCLQPLFDMVYFDPNSRFLLHESCINLPEKISHPFHPLHRLTLFSRGSGKRWVVDCSACGRKSLGFYYSCSVCEFFLGISCAFLTPTNKQNEYDQNDNQDPQFSHNHQLICCRRDRTIPLKCRACELPLDQSVYVCLECHIVQHESCAKMPHQLPHPFHLQHQLILVQNKTSSTRSGTFEPDYFICDVCSRRALGFSYACSDCRFEVEPRCVLSVLPPLIDCGLHSQHPLAYIELTSGHLECNCCKSKCHTPLFRCVQCRFNLHVYCIPELPNSVKHDCHVHPLTLSRTPIKDRPDEDEDAELYCHVCEERRRLVDPTYYCAECHFVAHPHCVISEILKCLGTERPLAMATIDNDEDNDPELDEEIARLEKEVDEGREKLTAMKKEVDKQTMKFEELGRKLDETKARRAPHLAFDRFAGL